MLLLVDHPLLAWLATYGIHSTLALLGAWAVASRLPQPDHRAHLLRAALLVGVASASLSFLGDRTSVPATADRTAPRALAPATAAALAPVGPTAAEPRATGDLLAPSSRGAGATARALPWESWLLGLWGTVALVRLGALVRDRARLARRLAGRRAVSDVRVHALARQVLDGQPHVRLTRCADLASPLALIRHEICLPEGIEERLDDAELSALLAHEGAHLARRDPAWLLALHALERVLWFQPWNPVVRRRWQRDIELASDDWAARRADPAALARCLGHVAGWLERGTVPASVTAMAHDRSGLVTRVERLLARRPRRAPAPRTPSVLALGLAFSAVAAAELRVGTTERMQPEPGSQQARMQPRTARLSVGPAAGTFTLDGFELVDGVTTVFGRLVSDMEQLERELVALRATEASTQVLLVVERGNAEELRRAAAAVLRTMVTPPAVEGTGDEADTLRAWIADRAPVEVRLSRVGPSAPGGPAPALQVTLGERTTTDLGQLDALLAQLRQARPHCASALVHSEPEVPFAEMSAVLARLSAAGIGTVHFAPVAVPEREWAAVLDLAADGAVRAGDDVLLPAGTDDLTRLAARLRQVAAGMHRAPAPQGGPGLPDERLLLRTAESTPFRRVQQILELCGGESVQIRKVELLVPVRGVPVPIWLPVDLPAIPEDAEPIERIDVVMRPARDGEGLEYHLGPQLLRDSTALTLALRRMHEALPQSPATLDPNGPFSVSEVLEAIDALVQAGLTDFGFVGAYPRERGR